MKLNWLVIILAAVIVLLVMVPFCRGQEAKPDPIFKNRIKLEDGSYIKKDPLFDNRWNQYDRSGRKTGPWREDDLIKDRWEFKPERKGSDRKAD